MDYEALINLLLENNKALKEELAQLENRDEWSNEHIISQSNEIASIVEARDEALEKMKRYREEVVWLQKAMADQSEKQPSKRCGNCAVWYHKKGRCNLGGGEPCKYWELYKP